MNGSRRVQVLVAAALLSLSFDAEARGQIFRYMCFGDSITTGNSTFDPTGLGGYPGRLPDLIGCLAPDCEVVNKGKDGERTSQGVTRIENLLSTASWDIVILMEGTNDVFNDISNNTIEANLGIMDYKARDYGVDTVHGSIIHLDPGSTGGMDPGKVSAVANMRTRVMNLASARNRYFADPWTPLCPNQSCFDQHYHNPPGAVGHPDPSGFDILAGVFEDSIESAPVPGLVTAISPTGTTAESNPTYTWTQEANGAATWYEFRLLGGATTLEEGWHEENAVCAGTQCSLSLDALPDGDYTWKVRGRSPRGRSGWRNTPFTIQTLLPPTTVTLTAPLGFTGDAEPAFEWQREEPRVAANYRLEVSDDGGIILEEVYPLFGNCPDTACVVDPFAGAPLAAGAYSWRVQGANAAGSGPWSETGVFELVPGLIFADGFESGDTSAWSETFP